MEKEFIGEVENWKDVCKKTDKLFKKGGFNAIQIISKQEYIESNRRILCYTVILKNNIHLKEVLKQCSHYSCSNSGKYELYITKVMLSDNEYNVMNVVYW